MAEKLSTSTASVSRRFWIILALATTVIVVAPLILFGAWSSIYANRVSKSLGEIRRRGEPVEAKELNSKYLIPAQFEDVTPLWRAAFEAMRTPEFRADRLEISQAYSKGGTQPQLQRLPRGDEPWPDLTVAESYLQRQRVIHDQWHEAGRRGGHARWRVDYAEIEHVASFIDYANSGEHLLRVEYFVHVRRGDAKNGAKTLETMLALRNMLAHEPCLVTQRVANRIDCKVLELLADAVCQVPFDEGDLSKLHVLVRQRRPREDLRIGLLGNRAGGYTAMRGGFQSPDDRLPRLPAAYFDMDFYLAVNLRYLSAFEGPLSKAPALVLAIDKEVATQAPKSQGNLTLAYSSKFIHSMSPILSELTVAVTKAHAADVGIAVELFRRRVGKLPATLAELSPAELPALPLDPYTDKPMLYRQTKHGFTIYSVGPDLVDDGGLVGEGQADVGLFFPIKE